MQEWHPSSRYLGTALMELAQKVRADLRERDRQEQELANSNTSGQQSSNNRESSRRAANEQQQPRAAASTSNPGEAASNSNSEPPTKKARAIESNRNPSG